MELKLSLLFRKMAVLESKREDLKLGEQKAVEICRRA